MQILKDNGYNDVSEIKVGIAAWTEAGYPVVYSTGLTTSNFTKVLTPFSLIPSDANGTPIPRGAVINHWDNKITEVLGPDVARFLVARDLESATYTTTTGDVRPVTWIYLLPPGTERIPGNDGEDFYLGDELILSVVTKSADYTD